MHLVAAYQALDVASCRVYWSLDMHEDQSAVLAMPRFGDCSNEAGSSHLHLINLGSIRTPSSLSVSNRKTQLTQDEDATIVLSDHVVVARRSLQRTHC